MALYTGPPQPLSRVLYDAPHSLQAQAYRPRELQHGTVNVDGTGVAWWQDDDEPLRYVTPATPWADPNLPELGRRLQGHTILAAVRGATPGIGFGAGAVAPFVGGGLALAHNGWIGGFREGAASELVRRLPDHLVAGITALTDSVLLSLLVRHHHEKGAELPDAVLAALAEIVAVCTERDEPATCNVLASDGARSVAVRYSFRLPGNSLYLHDGGGSWPDGARLVASEALDDDPAWIAVPEAHLVDITPDGHVLRTLGPELTT